jgi:PST family polysaccharide transporter
VPILNSLGFIIVGILGLWIVFRDFEIKFSMPSFANIKHPEVISQRISLF